MIFFFQNVSFHITGSVYKTDNTRITTIILIQIDLVYDVLSRIRRTVSSCKYFIINVHYNFIINREYRNELSAFIA